MKTRFAPAANGNHAEDVIRNEEIEIALLREKAAEDASHEETQPEYWTASRMAMVISLGAGSGQACCLAVLSSTPCLFEPAAVCCNADLPALPAEAQQCAHQAGSWRISCLGCAVSFGCWFFDVLLLMQQVLIQAGIYLATALTLFPRLTDQCSP